MISEGSCVIHVLPVCASVGHMIHSCRQHVSALMVCSSIKTTPTCYVAGDSSIIQNSKESKMLRHLNATY